MPTPTRCSDEEFIRIARELGPSAGALYLRMNVRAFHTRRQRIESRYGIHLHSPFKQGGTLRADVRQTPDRLQIGITDGCAIIGSDWHIWPGPPSLMHRAILAFCKEYRPQALIANGDVLDFCSLSRHARIGWEKQPTAQEELEAAQDQMHELEKATPRKCALVWPLGNHDMRFESKIANELPELAKVAGIHLKDHFPNWKPCWSVWINDVIVKHRFKGGLHATHNNTLWAGKTIVTGHLHSSKVTPFTDMNGDRYGVDTGCVADPSGPQFNYLEDNPRNWREGFCVLTFKGGRLMPPELVTRWSDDEVVFRGQVSRV